jgi:hypothetical protein
VTELHEVRTRPKGFWDFSQGGTSWVLFKKINKPKGFYFIAYFSVSRRISDKKVSLRRELAVMLKDTTS